VGQQAFLPHVRALVRTNGVRVGGGGRGAGCVVWCRERWTPRRDLMKPSRGLLKPARCAVALVQLAVPTGGLLQAIEAADIKRALRGSGAWGEGSGLRWARAPARAVSSPQRPSQPGEWRTARNRCITGVAPRAWWEHGEVEVHHVRARCKPPCVSPDGLESVSERQPQWCKAERLHRQSAVATIRSRRFATGKAVRRWRRRWYPHRARVSDRPLGRRRL